MQPRPLSSALLALACAAAPWSPARAATTTFNVDVTVNGMSFLAGSITADANNFTRANGSQFFKEEAAFTLADPALDTHCQFRWYQIITDLSESVRTADEFLWGDPAGTPTKPFVDPPNRGYQYQFNDGGADTSPFYENDDNAKYKDPSYADTHTPHVNSRTADFPSIRDDAFVNFETYLTVFDPTGECTPLNTFKVIAGFSWSIMVDADGKRTADGADEITNIPGRLGTLQTALNNSGFSDWTASDDIDLTCCLPAPGSISPLAALGLLALRRRRAAA